MKAVTMEKLYEKMEGIEKKISVLEKALVPKEEVSKKELESIKNAVNEMKAGDEVSFEDVFN
jgi:uncharacterized coiled-coil DUF342 family protein